MARVHEVLALTRKREVARKISERGYSVSGETLNRWVRDKEELPEKVDRIVRDLFHLPDNDEKAAPVGPERLEVYLLALMRKWGITWDELARAEADLAAHRALAGAGWQQLIGGDDPRGKGSAG